MKIELTPWQREIIVKAYADPVAVLDLIERVNELHNETLTLQGEWDCGAAPNTATEPK